MPHKGPPLDMLETDGLSIWSFLFENKSDVGNAVFRDADTGNVIPFGLLRRYCEALSTQLARGYNLRPGEVVSVCCANSLWYPVAVFAALRLGAVISPISPECTAEEAANMLRTVRPQVIIVDSRSYQAVERCLQGVDAHSARLIALTADDGASLGLPSVQTLSSWTALQSPVDAWSMHSSQSSHDFCAFLCFTSGTTSLPKATMISHRNIIAQLHQVKAYTRDVHPKVVLGVLPFHHITGVVHLLHLPLLLQQDVVVMSRFSMADFLKTAAAFSCDELWLVPPILIRLISDPTVNYNDLRSVRQINTGAAPLGREVISKLAAQYPNIAIRQAWGMTESCSCLTLTPPSDQTYENAHTVGKIVAGTLLKVVTPGTDEELGIGKTGEILAKGPQVMMGYLNDSKTTRQAIGPDGFLRTGDIGYVDEHGFVHIQDRLKEIIKVKGVGVAPAELEDVLIAHESIKDAAVVGVADAYSGQVPRAYVVLRAEFEASVEIAQSILEYVRQRCSRPKWLRGGVSLVQEIPKSGSGKILRRRLKNLKVILNVEGDGGASARL
ncbi:acetyl-CoA synthetase-like protein [Aspergillus germanicus]